MLTPRAIAPPPVPNPRTMVDFLEALKAYGLASYGGAVSALLFADYLGGVPHNKIGAIMTAAGVDFSTVAGFVTYIISGEYKTTSAPAAVTVASAAPPPKPSVSLPRRCVR